MAQGPAFKPTVATSDPREVRKCLKNGGHAQNPTTCRSRAGRQDRCQGLSDAAIQFARSMTSVALMVCTTPGYE